ncbi:MAG: phosphoglycerate dehydrogenase [Lachnospiraceae bacterium]
MSYQYHCLNPIADVGLERFTRDYAPTSHLDEADGIMVRSASMKEMEFGEHLKAIARAGAGVNNIPLEKCAEKGIVVFNTPGANANGVKELVIAGLLLASRDIIEGISWVQEYEEDGDIAKLAEKQKKEFAGCEIEGKKLGVIGLGAIGVLVANAAVHLGMDVYGYDPFVSVDSAWKISRSIHHAKTVDELYKECDYITIHVPAMENTKGMINKDTIGLMKKDVVILNFARDVLVAEEDMVDALVTGRVKRYVTDFPTPVIAGVKGAIVIPHLGASTEESEDNCAMMAVKEMMDFLENGNIKNSVNYPNCDMGLKEEGKTRITILHHNIPNMLGQFTAVLANRSINISDMVNKSKKEYAYTMLDMEGAATEELCKEITKIVGVLRVRVIA